MEMPDLKRDGVINDIIYKIISGKYRSGDKFPSLNEICSIYGIGRSTAQKLFDDLCKMGIAKAVAGSGYYIRQLDVTSLNQRVRQELTDRIRSVVADCMAIGMSEYEISNLVSEAILMMSDVS